jgi:hypothetical protein
MSEEALPEPFIVFISSSQNELQRLRHRLRRAINLVEFVDQHIMKAILIEDQRRPVIKQEIKDKIEKSAVYVGIFGRVRSGWTIAEFNEARERGLPLLVYHFKRTTRPGRPRQRAPGPLSPAERYLARHVMPLSINVRTYRSEAGLIQGVLQDLTTQVADMVNENAKIRKTIHKPFLEPVRTRRT